MQIRIEATDLPGRVCATGPGFPGSDNVHVGVQRKDRPGELLDLRPGDAPSAEWTLECTTAATDDGIEIAGPYVQNRLGGRFVYLSWVTVEQPDGESGGGFTMFRRAKLMLDGVPAEVLTAALRTGRLTARLGLSDPEGRPLCARVRPPHVQWSAEAC